MNGVQHACTRQHMPLPEGYQIVRCAHGKIGTVEYAVAEAFSRIRGMDGVFCYSAIPSDKSFSLVTLYGYNVVSQDLRDSVFIRLRTQMMYGKTPLSYVMEMEGERVAHLRGDAEVAETLRLYSIQKDGIIDYDDLLNGRFMQAEAN